MSTAVGSGGKQGKSGPQKVSLRPVVHQDTWFLRITPPSPEASVLTPPTVRWERRKRPANPPNPPRAGSTMAHHKGLGIMFGGVHDVEQTEEGIESEFFDQLYAWNMERNRFFPMSLRRPKGLGKKQQAGQLAKTRDRSKADEEELLQNLAALEAKKGIRRELEDEMDIDHSKPAEQDSDSKPEIVRFEMPHPRFNSQLAVQNDTLFIFGGTFERGDREFTFNDLYSIDLVKLDGVKEIFYNEPINWNIQDQEESDEDAEDYEDEDMEDEEEEDAENMSVDGTLSPTTTDITIPSITKDMEQLDVEEIEPEPTTKDDRPYPRPFESLRDFFTRTATEWQSFLMERLKEKGEAPEKSIKELRKEAFDLAEEKWWDSREEIMALEDEQEAAGIGEVVNMADKIENAGGAGRRR